MPRPDKNPALSHLIPCAAALALAAGCAVDGDMRDEGGYPVAAAATDFDDTPPALADLVGARAAGAEMAMTRRGYENRGGSKSDDSAYTYWEEPDTGRCVSIRTTDGRYQAILYTPEADCQQQDTASTGGDPVSGPTEYDASGMVHCSYNGPSFDQQCDFRVIRNRQAGAADIWIENIAGGDSNPYRVLYFANDQFTTRDNARLTWQRQGDEWMVGVAGREFYRIPDAVIVGG